ncbi:MAG: hypothetical protein ACI9H8_000590 [Lysobacterales bacterium]|jgi:uncharacterized protein YbaP (TraB family)
MQMTIFSPRLCAMIAIVGILCCPKIFAGEEQSLLWSFSSDKGQSGYLLGTIHSEDPRVLEYTEEFLNTLKSCDQFAMELVPNLPTLSKLAIAMSLPQGSTLASVIGQDRFASVEEALGKYGIPTSQIMVMKPWAAMISLSVPAPETGFFMDFSLSLRASGNGLKVIGLETLEEQLDFLENMPLEHQLAMLDQAVKEIDNVQEIHDQMVTTYLEGDPMGLREETETQLSDLSEGAHEYFMEKGIKDRNRRMLQTLLAALESGTVFAAVGALHLPGEDGLIGLLRSKGFELNPMPSPFPANPKEPLIDSG